MTIERSSDWMIDGESGWLARASKRVQQIPDHCRVSEDSPHIVDARASRGSVFAVGVQFDIRTRSVRSTVAHLALSRTCGDESIV